MLPAWMGLGKKRFKGLIAQYGFDYADALWPVKIEGESSSGPEEVLEVTQLLVAYANPQLCLEEVAVFAELIARACLGNEHLYHDLGLVDRGQLSILLKHNFPGLFKKNIHDMKWKKFIYRQLCEQAGLMTCRAPSCGVCPDYSLCFNHKE
ncbi:MAG: nitrogen fixation protein NifQ [Magnetococcales bacterium]|nr:nitrogen fixation protein NifQ [Magnetococcales bacterium]